MMKDKDRRLLDEISKTLAEAEQNLDAATLSRLHQARQAALSRRSSARTRTKPLRWGMAPTFCMIVVALFFFWRHHATELPQTPEFGDWQILTADESLDTYQEDIGFYEWLSEVMDTEDGRRNGGLPADAAATGKLTGWRSQAGPVASAGGHRIPRFI